LKEPEYNISSALKKSNFRTQMVLGDDKPADSSPKTKEGPKKTTRFSKDVEFLPEKEKIQEKPEGIDIDQSIEKTS